MEARIVRRRHFVGSLAALSFAERATAQQEQVISTLPISYGTFEEWLAAARSASTQFLQTPYGRTPNYFMSFLAMWGAAMPRNPAAWRTPWVELPGANERLEFNTLAAGRPFVVSAFRMAPGCLLPAHCHPGGGAITVCVQGSVMLEHFDLEPGSADFRERGGAVKVRYDSAAYLTRERYTWFTPERSNLHQLRAGSEGALGVDLAVQWEGAGEFSFLKFDGERAVRGTAVGEVLEGVWSGMSIADAYI
jgi:hypothetical protein